VAAEFAQFTYSHVLLRASVPQISRKVNPMTREYDYSETAARTLERAKGSNSMRTGTYGREIRAHIGGRLRSYFAGTQQISLPVELADLIEQISQETTELDQEPE
jgi:hypothetical protein